jgi:hypothetical protein
MVSYEDRTVKELKQLCKDRGLKVSGVKQELIDRLRGGRETSSRQPKRSTPVGTQTLKDLKQIVKEMGCVGYSTLRKDELLKLIENKCKKQTRAKSSRLQAQLDGVDPDTGIVKRR